MAHSSDSQGLPSESSANDQEQGPNRTDPHAPSVPSQLRESQFPPPTPTIPERGIGSHDYGFPPAEQEHNNASNSYINASTRLVDSDNWDKTSGCGSDGCSHGSFSPQPRTPPDYGSSSEPSSPAGYFIRQWPGSGDSTNENENASAHDGHEGSNGGRRPRTTKRSKTRELAQEHGIRNPRLMYLDYYIPFLRWVKQYSFSFLIGDLTAALTMASFYIPMSLSYAENLVHIPAINGLYAFAINPIIYAILGSSSQLVVGPEAAGSLLTGSVVRDSIKRGNVSDVDGMVLASIAGVVTAIAGCVLLVAGLARLGFVDNVLSKPFLRGFISAIGFVIFVDQLLPETGLNRLANRDPDVAHGSSIKKLIFLFRNIKHSHPLTCAVSFGSFAIIMVCREAKKRLQPRYRGVVFIPDRFIVVVLFTVLCWQLRWDEQGLAILGDVKSPTGHPFPAQMPFDFSNMKHIETALGTAFIIAMLGFFESSVAAKGLGSAPSDGIQNMTLSPNRELVALGTANLIGGVFMAIPAFGGYGRSKVNVSAGGRTPMSNILLSLITFFCIFVLLPLFYYIPKGVLAGMISVVSCTLLEEAPHDLRFFWKIRAWSELFLIFIVFIATIFYSLPLGIALGIGFSVLRVIKHASRPRIQILGRVSGTFDKFENAEAHPDRLEFFEGCLIIKIPEPLTFTNTGDLRNRLRRLEDYGSLSIHPALPRVRNSDQSKNIIFDVHGVTGLDGAGSQVLYDILASYRANGVRIFFCRVPPKHSQVWKLLVSSGVVELCGGPSHFVSNVGQALRMAESGDVPERYTDNPENDLERRQNVENEDRGILE